MEKEKVLVSWSGGKDSSLALYEIQKNESYEIVALFTTITKDYDRVTMHGVRRELLEEQARAIGVALHEVFIPKNVSNEEYNKIMEREMKDAKEKGVSAVVFGDIFLEDVRKYREENLSKVSMKGIFPLWKRNSRKLVEDFIRLGFKAVVVCVDSNALTKDYIGKIVDEEFLEKLPSNVDPAGENGEYHTFVFDGPIFKKKVNFKKGEIVFRENRFYYMDLLIF
ncbi:MAG: diphthine--ammonia ligase [Thermoproteota archaeon]|jgi:uncharacterized protein (TIGR00290 family)